MKENNLHRDGIENIDANDDAVLSNVSGGYGEAILAAPLTSSAAAALVAWLRFSTWDASAQQAFIDNCGRMYRNFKRTHVQAIYGAVSTASNAVSGLKSRALTVYNRITADTSGTATQTQICNNV